MSYTEKLKTPRHA